jgi:Sporulation and spore germination/Putative peptidoglycan binding domain/Bacterial extracellular solute-binding proteins, family 3
VTRSLRVAGLILAIAAAAPAAASPAGESRAASVRVYFLQGEQLVAVRRPGSTVKAAVNALLAGPTRAEPGKQFRTYVPSGTGLRSVRFASGVATVDLGERFAAGRDAESLSARITRLVYTVTAVPGVKSVRLLVSGGVPLGLFPGYAFSRPVTRAQATRPVVPPPKPPPDTGGQANPETRALQQRLADLGFLALDAVDGVAGEETRFPVIAFQKWERLARDGIAGPQTRTALARAGRPSPITSGGGGRRAEVLLDGRERVRPSRPLLFFASLDLLLEGVRTGRCEAAVLDAPILAAERAAAPYRYGALAGVLRSDERYGVVLQKGSPLTRRVNAAVRALVANGTLTRLQRRWLLTDLGSLRILG